MHYLRFWNEVICLEIEERNQKNRPTPKDHVMKERDMIGLMSLHTNSETQNFNWVFPWIELTNSRT